MDVGTGADGRGERAARARPDRAVDLVQEVCRIPSILGEEGPLAAFLASVMGASAFEDVELQPVVEDRPNAVGHVSLRRRPDGGPHGTHGHEARVARVERDRAVLRSADRRRRVRPRRDGHEGGARVSDRGDRGGASGGLPIRARSRWQRSPTIWAISWGRSLLRRPPADLCVLGELTDNEVCIGHRGPLLLRRHHARSLGAHLPQATGDQRERAGGAGRPGARRLEVRTGHSNPGSSICSARRYVVPGGSTAGSPGRPVDDPGRVHDPRRLPPAAGRDHRARCARRWTDASQAKSPTRGSAQTWARRCEDGYLAERGGGRTADALRGPRGAWRQEPPCASRTGWGTPPVSATRSHGDLWSRWAAGVLPGRAPDGRQTSRKRPRSTRRSPRIRGRRSSTLGRHLLAPTARAAPR